MVIVIKHVINYQFRVKGGDSGAVAQGANLDEAQISGRSDYKIYFLKE